MDATARPGTDADLDALWDLFQQSFGATERDRDRWMGGVDPSRCTVVDGPRGELAAASHCFAFEQWFGGRPVRLAGYSPVAVQPEHRGRGWGRLVTTGPFEDMAARGDVIAGLYPAALSLYRAVGFEVAGSYVARTFPARDLAGIRPARHVDVRRGQVDDVDAVHRCYDRSGPGRDGTLRRDRRWWQRSLPDDLRHVVLHVVDDRDRPGEVVGYLITRQGRGQRPYDFSTEVVELHADDPDVVRALWRVAASSYAQAPQLHVVGPAEDDLFLLADHADPEVVTNEIRWMLRLVDAAGAVAARGWPEAVTGGVHLDIEDGHAPWNAGRWVLEVDRGRATLERGGRGTVQASIGGLSCWWSGYASASRLARLGHLRSAEPGAVAAMDALVPAVPPVLRDFY